MSTTRDFREHEFDARRVDAAGRNVASHAYWRLYAVENLLRVFVHSVLTAELEPDDWWTLTASQKMKESVASKKADYASQPHHSKPGKHDIYYILLSELTKIITIHRNLFEPVVGNFDALILRLEDIRLPRNIVGHANWPSKEDRALIGSLHKELQLLLGRLPKEIEILVP
jgi:hypothetical protein